MAGISTRIDRTGRRYDARPSTRSFGVRQIAIAPELGANGGHQLAQHPRNVVIHARPGASFTLSMPAPRRNSQVA